MNIINKIDRVTQWAGEKMGQETKTAASEEFRALELEMALRHDGLLRARSGYLALWLTITRNGETAQVNDNLHEIPFEA
jgi:hypothetical protein